MSARVFVVAALLALAAPAGAESATAADVPLASVLPKPFVPWLSNATKRRLGGRTLTGQYVVWLGADGRPGKAETLKSSGDAAADDEIVATLLSLEYKAPRKRARVVVPVTLEVAAESFDPKAYRDVPPPKDLGQRHLLVTPHDRHIAEDIKRANAGAHLTGDYLIYVDLDGRVTEVEVRRAIPGCDDFVRGEAMGMRFPPPPERIRFLQTVEVTFPAAPKAQAAGTYRAVPPYFLTRTGGKAPTLPAAVQAQLRGKKVSGAWMVYVEPDGRVSRAEVVESIAGADDAVMEAIRTWTFTPPHEAVRSIIRVSWNVSAKAPAPGAP